LQPSLPYCCGRLAGQILPSPTASTYTVTNGVDGDSLAPDGVCQR